jgi:Ca-activated chloride channel homolog
MNQKTSRAPFRSVIGSVAFSVLSAACQHSAPDPGFLPIRNVTARAEAGPADGARAEAAEEPSKKAKDNVADEPVVELQVAPATAAAPVGNPATESAVVVSRPLSSPMAPSPREARRADLAGQMSAGLVGGGASMALEGRSRAVLAAPPEYDQEAYAASTDTSFALVKDSPLSTFSIDVDTASYANVRRFLEQGQLPPPGAVRIEEMINYFPYAYPDPKGETPISVTTELSVAPWNTQHRLLHVGVQGRRSRVSDLPARNMVFLIDVSGSMQSPNKLPLLKRSLATLTETLGERDQVAMVVYAGASGVVLPATSGDHKAQILAALDRLEAGGSTNGGAGVELAYSIASQLARPGATTRVILATDGDFNVGVTSEDALVRLITERRKTGVFLSVLGFGMGNYKDSTLEQLADQGNGNYAYVDSLAEARKVLVAEGGATLVTLAQDVKLQLEFNPQSVGSYRLIGYENRRLEARDFNDDDKDAGELGAGHGVTALYELIPPTLATPKNGVDPTKYQSAPLPTPGHRGELCTIKLRYQEPGGGRSRKIEHVVRDADTALSATSPAFRFSAAVATFGMTLRGSPDRGKGSFELARELARGAMGRDLDGYQREFIGLIDRASGLVSAPVATGPLVMP